jgi:hypothetical protein
MNSLRLEVSAATCKNFLSIPVEIKVIPVPAIDSVLNGSTCGPGKVKVSAFSSTADYLNWYDCITCKVPIQQGVSSIQMVLKESQNFYVEPVTTFGCTGVRVPVEAKVIPFDPAGIIVKGDSLVSNYISGNQWYFRDTVIDTMQGIRPQQSGTYKLFVQKEQCSGIDSIDFYVDKKDPFVIFPNPVTDQLTISNHSNENELFEVALMDMFGKEVLHGSGYKKINLDMTHIASGYYWILINSQLGIQSRIIQRK